MENLLCRSLTPVAQIRNSQGSQFLNKRGNQHGLIARKNRLAERHLLLALVLRADDAGAVLAVGTIREGLLNLAVLVAVQSTILLLSVTPNNGLLPGNLPWTWGRCTK